MTEIKSNLKLYFVKNNLTNKEIAEKMNKSPVQISYWVNGKSFPNLKDALKLSKLLSASVNELFELIDDDKPLE